MKKSFLLHHDICNVFFELSDEDAGKLIKEIAAYSISKIHKDTNVYERIQTNTGVLGALTLPFKQQIDRDLDKYTNVCERNRKSVNARWNKKSKKAVIHNDTKNTDKDKDKDKDINNPIIPNRDIPVVPLRDNAEIKEGDDNCFDRILKIFVHYPAYPKSKSSKEWKAYSKIMNTISVDHLEIIERFYKLNKSESCDKTWNRKTSAVTLMNQWSEQVDFASEYFSKKEPTQYINFV